MSFTITISKGGVKVGSFTGYATERAARIDALRLTKGRIVTVSISEARTRKTNPAMSADVAATLIQQLGGMGKLRAMVGASDFIRTERSGYPALTFKFKGSRKTNAVTITLDPTDTYTLDFVRIVKYDAKPVATFRDVYVGQLRGVFERTTGLRLSLRNPSSYDAPEPGASAQRQKAWTAGRVEQLRRQGRSVAAAKEEAAKEFRAWHRNPGKPPTFAVARLALLAGMKAAGWSTSPSSLKVPHATSPDGLFRLWFKPQAVHFTVTDPNVGLYYKGHRHDLGDAHTISYDLDIRMVDPAKFPAYIDRVRAHFTKG